MDNPLRALLRWHARTTDELPARVHVTIADDRNDLQPGDRVALIIEDDNSFARILVDIAREEGFKILVSQHGEDAIMTARKFRPSVITLDLTLPGMHGYAVLDRLKHDPSTRHIPIQIISIVDDPKRVMKLGAFRHILKPAERERLTQGFVQLRNFIEKPKRRLLLVEDDDVLRNSIVELLQGMTLKYPPRELLERPSAWRETERFDCVIIDLMLPDMEWSELIRRFKREAGTADLPVIVHTGKDLSKRETARIKKVAETIIFKDVDSLERLVDETALFLHRDVADLKRDAEELHETRLT
jgi:CheY-like chemotaxis protein